MSVTTGADASTDHYIGGERVPSGRRFPTISPIDQSLLAEVARADAADVDRAVNAAYNAFPDWAALGPAGRAEYLHRLADLIEANLLAGGCHHRQDNAAVNFPGETR